MAEMFRFSGLVLILFLFGLSYFLLGLSDFISGPLSALSALSGMTLMFLTMLLGMILTGKDADLNPNDPMCLPPLRSQI